jgi:hypothetical protein
MSEWQFIKKNHTELQGYDSGQHPLLWLSGPTNDVDRDGRLSPRDPEGRNQGNLHLSRQSQPDGSQLRRLQSDMTLIKTDAGIYEFPAGLPNFLRATVKDASDKIIVDEIKMGVPRVTEVQIGPNDKPQTALYTTRGEPWWGVTFPEDISGLVSVTWELLIGRADPLVLWLWVNGQDFGIVEEPILKVDQFKLSAPLAK